MVYSILESVLQFRQDFPEHTGYELLDKLQKLGVVNFELLRTSKVKDDHLDVDIEQLEKEEDKAYYNQPLYSSQDISHIVIFILYAYTEESPYKVLGRDLQTEKSIIFKILDIPESLRSNLLELSSNTLRKVVVDYVEDTANYEYKDLIRKQQSYSDIQVMVMNKDFYKESSKGIRTFDSSTYFSMQTRMEKLSKEIVEQVKQMKERQSLPLLDEIKKAKKEVGKGSTVHFTAIVNKSIEKS